MAMIQGNTFYAYDCTFSNLTFYNDDGSVFGFFGVRYQTSGTTTASRTDRWHIENVLFENIYMYKVPLFYMSADALTATNEVKLKNVIFNNVECDKGDNNFVPMLGGYGGVLNGLAWDFENIQVNNARADIFLYLEGKNDAVIKDITYNTALFDSYEWDQFSEYSLIFYADSTANIDVELSNFCILYESISVFFCFENTQQCTLYKRKYNKSLCFLVCSLFFYCFIVVLFCMFFSFFARIETWM